MPPRPAARRGAAACGTRARGLVLKRDRLSPRDHVVPVTNGSSARARAGDPHSPPPPPPAPPLPRASRARRRPARAPRGLNRLSAAPRALATMTGPPQSRLRYWSHLKRLSRLGWWAWRSPRLQGRPTGRRPLATRAPPPLAPPLPGRSSIRWLLQPQALPASRARRQPPPTRAAAVAARPAAPPPAAGRPGPRPRRAGAAPRRARRQPRRGSAGARRHRGPDRASPGESGSGAAAWAPLEPFAAAARGAEAPAATTCGRDARAAAAVSRGGRRAGMRPRRARVPTA